MSLDEDVRVWREKWEGVLGSWGVTDSAGAGVDSRIRGAPWLFCLVKGRSSLQGVLPGVEIGDSGRQALTHILLDATPGVLLRAH